MSEPSPQASLLAAAIDTLIVARLVHLHSNDEEQAATRAEIARRVIALAKIIDGLVL